MLDFSSKSHLITSNLKYFLFVLDINECSSQPCENDGTCTDEVNGYSCTCKAGYTDDKCGTGEKYRHIEIRFLLIIN